MAGHSKWANIKYKKEKADKQKGKIFSQIAKEIISSVKIGGADPATNTRLRLAIQKAKAANMPNDNIDRNISKASNVDQKGYDPVTYEIYGHGGVGLIVEAMTDNKNRTASDMRIATQKRGGNIAQIGSVAFNFDRKGVIQIIATADKEEAIFNAAVEAGAEDVDVVEDGFVIVTDPAALYAVKDILENKGFSSDSANIEMIPKNVITCTLENKEANLALIDWLEGLDDVNVVYHNMNLSEQL